MKVGDIVYHDWHSVRRYGTVQKIYVKQERGITVPWTHAVVDWFEDDAYRHAIDHVNTLREQSSSDFPQAGLQEYNCRHLKVLDLSAEIAKLQRLQQEISQ
jgi:hypothetical protein